MTSAIFTPKLSKTFANEYGNVITVSLIHRSAGLVARGSARVPAGEAWVVRVERKDMNTFHGRTFADKLDALDDYNARIGTAIAV